MGVYALQRKAVLLVYIPRAGARDGARNGDEGAVLDKADFRAPRGVEFRRAAPCYGCCLRLALPRPGVLYNFGAVVNYVGHASSQIIRVPCGSNENEKVILANWFRSIDRSEKLCERTRNGRTSHGHALSRIRINLQNKHAFYKRASQVVSIKHYINEVIIDSRV